MYCDALCGRNMYIFVNLDYAAPGTAASGACWPGGAGSLRSRSLALAGTSICFVDRFQVLLSHYAWVWVGVGRVALGEYE